MRALGLGVSKEEEAMGSGTGQLIEENQVWRKTMGDEGILSGQWIDWGADQDALNRIPQEHVRISRCLGHGQG